MTHENVDIPTSARWIADFIQRIGFPIFVSIALMIYIYFRLSNLENAFNGNARLVADAIQRNTDAVTALRHFLTHKYDE